jgi:hypothetical protein
LRQDLQICSAVVRIEEIDVMEDPPAQYLRPAMAKYQVPDATVYGCQVIYEQMLERLELMLAHLPEFRPDKGESVNVYAGNIIALDALPRRRD